MKNTNKSIFLIFITALYSCTFNVDSQEEKVVADSLVFKNEKININQIEEPPISNEERAGLHQQKSEMDYYQDVISRFPFSDYPVQEMYQGEIAELELSNFKETPKDIKNNILQQYKQQKEANFAGRYIIISWGCGSPCQMNAIVDASTGVTQMTFSTSLGIQYEKDSYLLIKNPPNKAIYSQEERATLGHPEYCILKGGKLLKLN